MLFHVRPGVVVNLTFRAAIFALFKRLAFRAALYVAAIAVVVPVVIDSPLALLSGGSWNQWLHASAVPGLKRRQANRCKRQFCASPGTSERVDLKAIRIRDRARIGPAEFFDPAAVADDDLPPANDKTVVREHL